MARPLRIESPDATYHVTSRGNEQRDIFYSDDDRKMFLGFLAQAIRRFGWRLSAWVLMSNHYHLVIRTPQPNLSKGMQWLNGRYAQWFNRTHQRVGHLFQGRFKGLLIERDRYFAEVLRYVVLNPVRAKMVEHPENYRWSSYRATAGLEDAPVWLDNDGVLAIWGNEPGAAEICYRQFVLDKLGVEDPLWQDLVNGMYLGSDAWAKEMRKEVESKLRSTDHPKAQRAIGRPTIDRIVDVVAKVAAETSERIRSKREASLRGLVAWIAWNEGWITLRSIAAALRLRSEGHISNMIRNAENLLGSSATLRLKLDCALDLLAA